VRLVTLLFWNWRKLWYAQQSLRCVLLSCIFSRNDQNLSLKLKANNEKQSHLERDIGN
jgi:hypothetical protein